MTDLLQAAITRARGGEPVLPIWWTDNGGVCQCPKKAACASPGKHPLTRRGLDDASVEEETVRGWFTKWPDANLAVCTDLRPRFDVDLVEVAQALLEDPTLPHQTEVVRTPSGGLHLTFATDAPTPTKSLTLEDGRMLGDLKAARAYVLVPPSKIGERLYRLVGPAEAEPMSVADPLEWIKGVLPEFGFRLATNGAAAEHAYAGLGEGIPAGRRHNVMTSYAGRIWVEGMSPATLVELMELVNARLCRPPLPDDELRSIVDHFIKSRAQGALHVNGAAPPDAEAPVKAQPPEYRFVPATTNAFVEKYISWRTTTNDAPLEYAEAHAIATLAAIAGPRLRIPVREKPRPLACNLLVVLVGPSTLSRKSDVQNHTQLQIQELIPESVMSAPGSSEGLVQDLALHQEAGAVLFVDELAWWFAALKRKTYLSEMKGYLMRAYDGSTISRRNRSKGKGANAAEDADVAQEPCLSILGTSTPERLAQVSTMEDVDDGWWPRWAIIWPEGRPPTRPMGPPDEAVEALRSQIAKDLETISTRLGEGVQAVLDEHAWQAANEAFERMEASATEDPDFGPFISRMELRMLKIAALLALADDALGKGNVHVTEDHILQAEVVCDRWLGYARRFSRHVGLNEFEYALNKAWSALQRNGGRAARRDVARAAHVPARVMDEIERTLEDRGLIEIADQSTQGRSRKVWVAIRQ